MSFLRRHKQQPLDLPPNGPPDRAIRRLTEIAEEWQGIEAERIRLLSKQCVRAGVDVWAGFLREERTAVFPTVQPRGVAPDQPAV